MNATHPILHLVMNPARLAAAGTVMMPDDQLVLCGEAVALPLDSVSGVHTAALVSDARELGVRCAPDREWIDDSEWVRRIALAERVVQW